MEIPVNPNEKKKGLGNKLKISGLGLVVLAFLGIIALGASQTSISTQQPAKIAHAQTPQCASGDQQIEAPKNGSKAMFVDVDAGCRIKGDVDLYEFRTSDPNHAYTEDATAKDASKDAKAGKEGNIVECPDGCLMVALHGANISPRSYQSLFDEMKKTGCKDNKGCSSIIHWCWSGGELNKMGKNDTCASKDHNDGGATATPTTTPMPKATSTTPPSTATPQATSTSVPTSTPSPKKDDKSNKAPTNPTPGKSTEMAGSLANVPLDDDMTDNPCDFNIAKGTTVKVMAGCIISGDVMIAATADEVNLCKKHAETDNEFETDRCAYHDNKPLTGHIVLMMEDGYVYAAWGASVHSPGINARETVRLMKLDMGQTGCGNKTVFPDGRIVRGCADGVFAVQYPNKKPIPTKDPNVVVDKDN
ncbi:MAG TPA: hypothetical protein VG917_01185 [Patescibacteria group bacterium]|nr:hypothetical protein [Patescibacteria group bacterium]